MHDQVIILTYPKSKRGGMRLARFFDDNFSIFAHYRVNCTSGEVLHCKLSLAGLIFGPRRYGQYEHQRQVV